MKFKLLTLILLGIIIGQYLYYANKLATTIREKNACVQTLAAKQLPDVSLNDLFLAAQKQKAVAEATKGMLYFSVSKTAFGQNTWGIEIKLRGGKNVMADAADLQIDFDKDVEIVDIATGDAFPLYPRKTVSGGSLIITGVALIEKNSFSFGTGEKTYATLKVKTNGQKTTLKINPEGTKIFFSADDVLDHEQTLKEIVL